MITKKLLLSFLVIITLLQPSNVKPSHAAAIAAGVGVGAFVIGAAVAAHHHRHHCCNSCRSRHCDSCRSHNHCCNNDYVEYVEK